MLLAEPPKASGEAARITHSPSYSPLILLAASPLLANLISCAPIQYRQLLRLNSAE